MHHLLNSATMRLSLGSKEEETRQFMHLASKCTTMRLYLSIALTALAIGFVSSQGVSPTCDEQTIPVCCTVFGPLNNAVVQKAFGSDLKMPSGDAGIDCHKSVCLISPSMIVRNSFKPREFFDFSLSDRIEYERLLQDSIRATADEVISSKNALQAFVKAHLRTPEEYRRLEEIDRARYYGRKRVLTGTIQTNGHDLKALVLDVTQRKSFQDLSHRPRTTRMLFGRCGSGTRNEADVVDKDFERGGGFEEPWGSQEHDNLPRVFERVTRHFERVTARKKRKAKVVHQLRRNDLPGTEPLRKFYGTASYKTKTRNLRVAEYAFKHEGIDRIMQETGCTDRWQSGQVRSLFVVGVGDFGSKRGPSLHMTFLRRLKKMVR
ncbi:hypothetical protein K457DRAFT_19480 [Linnemannia elongata AG-77]|uniref:Uncharacterized protein n=1 Tax=Linnemannia elongata AG-77 TaxID=1314771 RepID=A0A197JV23_9FUNG|nr:hypothetical protein K457DRAFT_19480 [Linnemannia elongata AG-77]